MARFTVRNILAFWLFSTVAQSPAAQQQSLHLGEVGDHMNAPMVAPMHVKQQHEEEAEAKGTLGILDALEDSRNGASPGEPTS